MSETNDVDLVVMHRTRRGKLVEVPDEWVGKTLHPQTKRKRRSKQGASARRGVPSHPLKDGTWPSKEYREKRYAMLDEDA